MSPETAAEQLKMRTRNAILLLALMTAPNSGQDLVWTRPGGPDSLMGLDITPALGDYDGDLIPDLVVSAPSLQDGEVLLLSAVDGTVLWSTTGPGQYVGRRAAGLGDLDGDGKPEVGYTSWNEPDGMSRVRVVSPSSGTELALYENSSLMWIVRAVGDLDHDGISDYGVAWRSQFGRVEIRSGASHTLLRQHTSGQAWQEFGEEVDTIGDVTGDGVPDYAIGEPNWGSVGASYVYSGGDGQQLMEIRGNQDARSGSAIAPLGDVNADGTVDFAIGAPLRDQRNRGEVRVVSGADFSILHEIRGNRRHAHLGEQLAGVGDVNLDGYADFVTNSDRTESPYPGEVVLFSGRTARRLYEYGASFAPDGFGGALALAGDVDGDGNPELALGAILGDQPNVQLRSLRSLQLDARPDRPNAGESLHLQVAESIGNEPAVLFLVAIDDQPLLQPLFSGTLDTSGALELEFTTPPGLDVELTLRAYSIDSAGQVVPTNDERIILPAP